MIASGCHNGFAVRSCRDAEEYGFALYAISQYHRGPQTDEEIARFRQVLELERMHAAFEGERIIGGAGAFTFELSVPGGTAPCAGITTVGVYPTHRRRGVLTALMRAQLEDAHARAEPIAVLSASEGTIYGRYGYGIASWAGQITIRRRWGEFARPISSVGELRFVTPAEALERFPRVWEAVRRERPGLFSRSKEWWLIRRLQATAEDPTPRRLVALDVGEQTSAYAIFRIRPGTDEGISASGLEVLEALGSTPEATARIWRFLLDVDTIDTVTVPLLPPDHPLFLLLADPRRARYRVADRLWVRLIDVREALLHRSLASKECVVIRVEDPLCPWNEGSWRVAADEVRRVDADPEIVLDVDALGSTYLGAVSFRELRGALRLEERVPGAVERADALFAWRPLPWCPEVF